MQAQTTEIYYGDRGQNFIDLIKGFLKKGKLDDRYINVLTTPDAMQVYSQAFTHISADPVNNYEYMEFLGDSIANAAIVWYMDERFPQLHCPAGVKILARLKINYVSKKTFFQFAKDMGFWPFITASMEIRMRKMKDLLEDCLEAMFGATTQLLNQKIRKDVGFAIIPSIVKSLYDGIHISLDYYDLYDSKTILKQIFDKKKILGQAPKYIVEVKKDNQDDEFQYSHVRVFSSTPGQSVLLGEGTGALKATAEQNAAKAAIKFLGKNYGITPDIPEDYLMICDKS